MDLSGGVSGTGAGGGEAGSSPTGGSWRVDASGTGSSDASGASLMPPLRTEDVREALVALTSRDPALLRAALTVLHRACQPGSGFQHAVVEDSGVQRVAFFIAALATGASSLKSSVTLVEMSCACLAALLAVDTGAASQVAKDCGSRVFAGLLKLHFPNMDLAASVTRILLAISKYERNYGLVARLDGGIHMLLQLLQMPSLQRDPLLVCVKLLGVYCKGSDNNVHLVAKKGGLLVAVNLVKVHMGDNEVLAAVFTLLGHVALHARHSTALGDLGVCEALVTLLSLRTTDCDLAETVLGLVGVLADSPTNVTRLWTAGALQVMWLVVTRFGTDNASLLKATSTAMWKILSARGIGYCVDLDGLHRWELPIYPAERGCRHPAALLGMALPPQLPGSDSRGSPSEATDGGKEDGSGGGGSSGSAARQMAEALAAKASDARDDSLLDDMFPENDPVGSATQPKPPELAAPTPAGVSSTSHGVQSVIPFKVPWPSCPSVLQAASNNSYAPLSNITDAQRAGLVQFMMLSVVARLMRPVQAVGELVYDRYSSGVAGGGDLLPLESGRGSGGADNSVPRATGARAGWGLGTSSAAPPPPSHTRAKSEFSVTTGDPEADALLFYAADEADDDGAAAADGKAGEGSSGAGAGAGAGAGGGAATSPGGRRPASAGVRRSIQVRVPEAKTERPSPTSGSGKGSGGSGILHGDGCATVGLSLDPEDLTVEAIVAHTAAEEKEWASVPPLRFESRFECGNLRAAVRVAPREYDVVLAPDINNGGHTQWFYFHVRDFEPGGARYRFNIINLEKKDSTYNHGMRPLMYCTFVDEMKVSGWQRVGDDICYFQNHFTKHSHGNTVVPVPTATAAAVGAAAAAAAAGGVGGSVGAGGGLRAGASGRLLGGISAVESSSSITSMGSVTDDTGAPPGLINLYTASFSLQFPADARGAFVAYCYPYSFTDLMLDIREWDDRAERVGRNEFVAVTKLVSPAPVSSSLLQRAATVPSSVMRRTVLCRTLAGNAVPLVTITNFSSPQEEIDTRPYIVLSARVHPGETNASWMMRGVMDFLTSSAREADMLRDLVIFKIVPFLNPDGVINGHHRCNLSGEDLNRHWTSPVKGGTPTVWYTKRLLSICRRRRVAVFCDFHGHSRKKNIFMFGCEHSDGTPERVFPRLLDRCAPDFSYKNCNFSVQKSKANCARVAVWRDLGITNSYTLEASFCGADQGPNKDVHFTPRNYEEMGHHFCCALLDMMQPNTEKLAEVLLELQQLHPGKFMGGGDRGRKKGGKKKRGRTPTRRTDLSAGSSAAGSKRSPSAGSTKSKRSIRSAGSKSTGGVKSKGGGKGKKASQGVAANSSARRSTTSTSGKVTSRKRPPRTSNG